MKHEFRIPAGRWLALVILGSLLPGCMAHVPKRSEGIVERERDSRPWVFPQIKEQAEGAERETDLRTLIHYGPQGVPQDVGTSQPTVELGVALNGTGSISSFIDFEACLHHGTPAACDPHEKMGILQDMSKPALPVTLDFNLLSIPSQSLIVFVVPAEVEAELRANWKSINPTYPSLTWKALTQALAHLAVTAKFQDFSALRLAEERWGRVLKRWLPQMTLPAEWAWHERLTLYVDPAWGTTFPLSPIKKSWLRSVLQSPLWIWQGLIERAARHREDFSPARLQLMKDHLQTIRQFESTKADLKELRVQENNVHGFQRKIQGSVNCWNRTRVAFRRLTTEVQARYELTPTQFNLLNGRAAARDLANARAELDPEAPVAKLFRLDEDLYRDPETRPLAFDFDENWSRWIDGFTARGGHVPDGTSAAPLAECQLRYEK